MSSKKMVPVYVSLAQTYLDDKQYLQAVSYYKLELQARDGDLEQVGVSTDKRVI